MIRTGPTDVEQYKDRQRRQWDRVAAGWEKWWQTIENGAHHIDDRLVDLAQVAPGKRVLDIATGIGEPALTAASRVGSAGRVVATDISKQMLDIARIRARTSGLTNVEFLEVDAQRLDFPDRSFDAILCRWGITSLPNYSNLLSKIKRMLTPNGAFATSVWDEASRSPLTSIAITVAQEMFQSAPPRLDSTHEVPEDSLESVMIRAGFTDVRTEKLTVTLELASTEAFTQYLVDVSPVVAALVSDQPPVRQAEYQHLLAKSSRVMRRLMGAFVFTMYLFVRSDGNEYLRSFHSGRWRRRALRGQVARKLVEASARAKLRRALPTNAG